MLKDFRDFALKGNVVDLAFAVIIGAAFGRIVTSFVNDIVMPPLGLVLGHVDFSSLFVNLSGTPYKSIAEAKAAGAATINYGVFINTIIDFVIVAFVLFLMVQQMSRLKREQPSAPPSTKECRFCLTTVPLKATRCPACTSELGA